MRGHSGNWGSADDDFDDNRDDRCSLNHHRYNPEVSSSCLVTNPACSWRCGVRDSTAVSPTELKLCRESIGS
jgi:hypothetical protein